MAMPWYSECLASGKSFFCKSEMLWRFLKTDDDILVIDPTLEYFDIARNLGGECLNLSNYTQNYINPLWIDVDQLDLADSKGLIREKGGVHARTVRTGYVRSAEQPP